MTFEQFGRSLFEDHWIVMSFLSPAWTAAWAFGTKQWAWFAACYLWLSWIRWGKDKLRDKEISEAVVTRLDAEKAKGGA